MRENIQNHILLALTLVLLSLSIIIGSWFVHYNQRELELKIRTNITEQHNTMFALAEITDRNGADEAIANIISDCSRRDEYESLLVKLNVLTRKDLITLQNLSDACGNFYDERKALMVARLDRELTSYIEHIAFLETLTTSGLEEYNARGWIELVELEKARSTLLTDQKNIQVDIISALINGEYVHGVLVSGFVQEAQRINELLIVYDKQIDEKREQLR